MQDTAKLSVFPFLQPNAVSEFPGILEFCIYGINLFCVLGNTLVQDGNIERGIFQHTSFKNMEYCQGVSVSIGGKYLHIGYHGNSNWRFLNLVCILATVCLQLQ